ncbi:putative naringenin-chalcone synthase [Mycetocola sp. CAN_C7]|uniref:type III polyketide synthase n=1 Tax=Mycetocola sp. CAN_C7 TaxID=2787724 RepID=UPI0018CA960A
MPAYVRTIETALPSTVLVQSDAREIFAAQPGLTRLGERLVRTSFDVSGIETRRTVIGDFTAGERTDAPVFYDQGSGLLLSSSTGVRNNVYIRAAGTLFAEAGKAALDATPGITAADVTHVVTVSCTGFYAPGPDYELVRELGLPTTTQRFHIGFMGCYAVFPALRAAAAFCAADPDAVVLIVSCELCTIHVRSSNDPDQIVASSVFADGAAGAIVTARAPEEGPALRVDRLASELTPVGEEDMAWTIGDAGFEMVLSARVPKIIDAYIGSALVPLFSDQPDLAADPAGSIRHWAIHPGGRSILDKVEAAIGLSGSQLEASRRILRDFGNMSSATVLFVLKEILDGGHVGGHDERVCAMAFGPGLTVETGLFTRIEYSR